MQVLSLGWEDPLEERMATHFSILVYRILMDKGAWWATVHRVTKSRTQLKQLSRGPASPGLSPTRGRSRMGSGAP